MRHLLGGLLAIVLAAALSSPARAEGKKKSFTIPKYGELTLTLPEDWEATLESPKDGSPIRINVLNKDSKNFHMVITPVNPPGDKEPATADRVRKMLEVERI